MIMRTNRKLMVHGIAVGIGFLYAILLPAQNREQELREVNQGIDQAVVSRDLPFLQKHYAADFVFTHGTGYVEGKESWLKNVADANTTFVSRQQDSTTIELHDDIGIVRGKIDITRLDRDMEVRYGIWYIRTYRFRDKRWQMISHFTFREWHHP